MNSRVHRVLYLGTPHLARTLVTVAPSLVLLLISWTFHLKSNYWCWLLRDLDESLVQRRLKTANAAAWCMPFHFVRKAGTERKLVINKLTISTCTSFDATVTHWLHFSSVYSAVSYSLRFLWHLQVYSPLMLGPHSSRYVYWPSMSVNDF